MRKRSLVVALALLAACFVQAGFAQKNNELNPFPRHMPTKARFVREFARPGGGGTNLSYHGGGTITNAKVVPIFWGAAWSTNSTLNHIAQSLTNYIGGNGSTVPGYGKTGEYNVITQYYGINGVLINQSALGTVAIYDSNNPLPANGNVTDAAIQAEVNAVTGGTPDPSTIYEVFLPTGTYSSDGNATSCGGPNLTYCAYHGNFNLNGIDTKYASMPYPSCGGCQSSGFNDTQNFEHFISHETREAVTDEDGTAWFDRRGYEADDKCAWSPTPFTDSSTGTNTDGSGFAYQYEWSNASSSCVKTKP
ncbi:MAG TPA: hypothetical protein VFU86_03390 [Terriglobales bacterium]|nr:hypothetical protein [Terriglobales bacterium]